MSCPTSQQSVLNLVFSAMTHLGMVTLTEIRVAMLQRLAPTLTANEVIGLCGTKGKTSIIKVKMCLSLCKTRLFAKTGNSRRKSTLGQRAYRVL